MDQPRPVTVENTKRGPVGAWVRPFDSAGFVAYIDGTRYPDLAGLQGSGATEAEAVDQLRRAIDRR